MTRITRLGHGRHKVCDWFDIRQDLYFLCLSLSVNPLKLRIWHSIQLQFTWGVADVNFRSSISLMSLNQYQTNAYGASIWEMLIFLFCMKKMLQYMAAILEACQQHSLFRFDWCMRISTICCRWQQNCRGVSKIINPFWNSKWHDQTSDVNCMTFIEKQTHMVNSAKHEDNEQIWKFGFGLVIYTSIRFISLVNMMASSAPSFHVLFW